MENKIILFWEICPKEYKKNIVLFWQKMIPFFLTLFAFIGFYSQLESSFFSFPLLLWFLFLGLLIPLIIILFKKISKEEERVYKIFDDGIFIKKGKKEKKYLWEVFSSFYEYSWLYDHVDEQRFRLTNNRKYDNINVKETKESIKAAMEEVLGKIFYLEKIKKKRFSFIKKYVVVRTLPDNYSQIEEEIGKKLNKGKWLPEKEIGLVLKEFN